MAAPLRRRVGLAARAPIADVVSGAAAVAAVAVASFSVGTWGVLAVLLALAAWDVNAAVVAGMAGMAVAARLGSADLAVLAGTQSVLGPAALAGPLMATSSVWLSSAALLLVSPGGLLAVPFGLSAALLLAGPAGWSAGGLAVRLVAAAACIELAVAAPHLVHVLASRARVPGRAVAAGLSLLAVTAALASRPDGWRLSLDGAELARGFALAAAVVMVGVVPSVFARRRLGAPGDA